MLKNAAVVIGLALLCVGAQAQVTSEIKGQVTDGSGAALVSARVQATEMRTQQHFATVTTSDGYFNFANLAPGKYQLDVEQTGFQHLTRSVLSLLTGQTLGVTLTMHVGEAQETVTVSGDAPLLQTQTSDVQFTIPAQHIQAIPLNSRNFIQLATLAPGVELPPGTLLPRINGGRPRTNEYLYDGISALQPEPGQVAFFPIIDDIQEFAVETNNVAAEFGRFNGGVVNLTTRYGTNDWHGSLFEYLRNEDLNARNYFAPTGRKPEYRRNLYGGTIGGPVLHDKLFFFGDYQGIKQLIGKTVLSTVPTTNERAGIFTDVSTIYDPTTTTTTPSGTYTRMQFPNNLINKPLDPASLALLARIPLPNLSGTANNYTRTANDSDHQSQFDVRVDGAVGAHDHAFGRYTYYNEVEQPVTPFPDRSGAIMGTVLGTGNVVGLSNVLGQQAVVSETHTFSARVVNDARFGYTRRGNTTSGVMLGNTASAALGIPGIPTNAAFNNALPLFTFTGFQQLGTSASTFSQYQTAVSELVDSVSITRGQHSIKVGGDLRWYQLNAVSPPNPTGSFAFTTTGTDTQGASGATGGNAFASFLLGQVDTFSIDLQQSKLRPRDFIEEYFAQDDWRVTPKLTFNLGARWTLHHPSTEKTNQGAIFNTSTQVLDYVGVNGNSRSARELHWNNVAPRIGLAYALNEKTAIRSGFGIVFIDQSGITTPFTVPQFPFIQNVQQATQDSINSAFTLSNGPTVAPIALTPNAGLGQSVYTVTRAAGSGYVQQWNVAVQRAVTNNLSVGVTYVGSHIVHVGIPDSNFNQLTAAQLATGLTNPASLTGQVANPYYGQIPASSSIGKKTVAAAQLLKPYPRFQNVAIYRNNTGETNYNAIEFDAEQRLSHGLSFTFAYTHSKLIDDASSVFSSTVLSSPNSSSLIAADTYRPYLERDSSSGDMPNVTAGSVVYELPMGRGHRFASGAIDNALLGGWSVNVLATAQSGMPVTVTQATNSNSFAGFALQRPNVVAKTALPAELRTPQKFFNTAAFATAPQFTIGNASRNPVRGPAYRDLDLSLIKGTALGEKTTLEFRAELFNVTNTPAFGQPNGSFGTTAFGSITTTVAEERVAQFALRLRR
jgi:Carboxypeptidase regulatory-like domain